MSDFDTQGDYEYGERTPRQTRATERRRLPLWPLAVILLVILAVVISFPNLFRPSTQPTVEIIPTNTPALPTPVPFPTATPTPGPRRLQASPQRSLPAST